MLKAETIDPYKRKSKISCSECFLSYSARDYKILYENEKLAFFKFKLPSDKRKKIYCNNCLYESIETFMGEKPGKMKLYLVGIDGNEVIVTFHKE